MAFPPPLDFFFFFLEEVSGLVWGLLGCCEPGIVVTSAVSCVDANDSGSGGMLLVAFLSLPLALEGLGWICGC